MKKHKGKILIGLLLLLSSVVLHFIHYLIFHDLHHLAIYLIGDLALIPLEVLFVSLVFEHLIEVQNLTEKKKKTYMLVEVFYMEIGNKLLSMFSHTDEDMKVCTEELIPEAAWTNDDFKRMKRVICTLKFKVDMQMIDLEYLFRMMRLQKKMLINVISNPVLTEHDDFSDTILATFHLLDELEARDLNQLDEDDIKHLKVDIERAYKWLAEKWVDYMEHVRKEYPFLYNKAIQTNPFTTEL